MTTRIGPLITCEALAELIGSAVPAPVILDVRWQLGGGADHRAYADGHIPNAVFVDLDRQLADPPSRRGRHPLPGAERFTADMRAAGVSNRRPVVVYDAKTSMAAARAWWLLCYFGHPEVAVLESGLAGWGARGHPVTSRVGPAAAGDFVARAGGMPVVTGDQAAALPAQGVLIDARAPERFHGWDEPVDPVAGHIPGGRNRPTAENLDADGRFLGRTVLRRAFQRLGVREEAQVAAYCGSGVNAAHEVLALQLAGYEAALYPGSWSEWITDPERPVVRDR
jgi:thiosulfate/3-mercaptopyruvate sulfurtransferase